MVSPTFYFDAFEQRVPPEPLPSSRTRELVWHFLATISLTCGAWYIVWRWGWSLNPDALWFAIPLAIAETCAYLGMVLFVINLWTTKDCEQLPPPMSISACVASSDAPDTPRPIRVDIFIATYNEDPELVRLSIRDAKRLTYPHPIDLLIHVLDDGRRARMRQVADEEHVGYITRATNEGFKAGNLRNGVDHTSGDFLVICDADTRLFPTFLEHTLGYFRDPDVAWVQTPQWFFDLPEGVPLRDALARSFGLKFERVGAAIGGAIEQIVGPIRLGADPFCNDARFFYDVLQRRRNWANASFCCGAGSIHRREAVIRAALRRYADAVNKHVAMVTSDVEDVALRADLAEVVSREMALETDLTPFKFHVSEDIYTSILLHSDPSRRWKSVLHPRVESKMLSPQDMQSWMSQRFKYAGGSFDIALHDNPVFRRGMTLPQRLMYAATFWAYFGCLWNVVFLLAPIIYLSTGIAPVRAYTFDFFKHALPFMFFNELALIVGLWGIAPTSGRAMYLAFFPVAFQAFWKALKGERISFPATPKERQRGKFLHLVRTQIALMGISLLALGYGVAMELLGLRHNGLGLMANACWMGIGVFSLGEIVRAAVWQPPIVQAPEPVLRTVASIPVAHACEESK
jgi:cellulose synthase (UDP-forming)